MSTSRKYRYPPGDQEALWRQEIERRLAQLERSNRLTSASIGSGGLGVKDGGSIVVEGGSIVVEGGSIIVEGGDGVELSSSGLEVNGGQVVAVSLDSDFQTYDSVPVSLSNSYVTYLTKDYTPPDWATQVLVVALGEMEAYNAEPTADNVRLRLDIEGAQRNVMQSTIWSGDWKPLTAVAFQTLTTWSNPISVEARARSSLLGGGAFVLQKLQLSTLFIATVA